MNNKLKLLMNENYLLIFIYDFLTFLGYQNRQNIYYIFGLLVLLKIFINHLNELENHFSKRKNLKIILFSLCEVIVLILLEPFAQWINNYFPGHNAGVYFFSIFIFSIFVCSSEILFEKKNNSVYRISRDVEQKIIHYTLIPLAQLKYTLRLKILFNLSMGKIKLIISDNGNLYAIKFKMDIQKRQKFFKKMNTFIIMILIIVASFCYIFLKISLLMWCLGFSSVFFIYISMIFILRKERFKKNVLIYRYQISVNNSPQNLR